MEAAPARRKVLVVDDEPHIVELLAMNLRQDGYDSCSAGDGRTAIDKALSEKPDLVLLDLMLPGLGGLETCRLLRSDPRTSSIPIIMLTAKSEECDKVIGLGIGADDYVTKPFGLRELVARIEVALRHAATPAPGGGVLRTGGLEIDEGARELRRGPERIALSPTEFELLAQLARNAGNAVARRDLEGELGIAAGGDEGRALDVHVRNLRRKLGARPGGGEYVTTVRGTGYRFDA
jgi:two-component system, OmpR family, alkaline phosphatase synthesis response regulator PhoP